MASSVNQDDDGPPSSKESESKDGQTEAGVNGGLPGQVPSDEARSVTPIPGLASGMSSGNGLKLAMVLGSVRQGRMVDRVAKFAVKSIKQHAPSITVETLDPLELDKSCGLNRQPLHFLSESEKEDCACLSWMNAANEAVKKANAFLILATEYNGNMPPALLNLLNSLPPSSFRHRPVGIITYTSAASGAMRALNVARPFLTEIGMVVLPGYVAIPMVQENIDEEGNCKNDRVNMYMMKLAKNLEWYARAIVSHQENGNPLVD